MRSQTHILISFVYLNNHVDLRQEEVGKGISIRPFNILLEYETNTDIIKTMPYPADNV